MKTKKEIERRVLNGARSICSFIPSGEDIFHEEPDVLIKNDGGDVGVEITEALRPASNGGFLPIAEENLHREVVCRAEEQYYRDPNAKPVNVLVYFNNGGWHNKKEMACALAEFVSSHHELAKPVATFSKGLPALFFSVTIAPFTLGRPWGSEENGGYTVTDIYEQLASRIKEKNDLLPTYRTNLPNIPIWLLIYSAFSVSRGLSIPHGISDWRVQFGFEKVLFFSSLSGEVAEIYTRR